MKSWNEIQEIIREWKPITVTATTLENNPYMYPPCSLTIGNWWRQEALRKHEKIDWLIGLITTTYSWSTGSLYLCSTSELLYIGAPHCGGMENEKSQAQLHQIFSNSDVYTSSLGNYKAYAGNRLRLWGGNRMGSEWNAWPLGRVLQMNSYCRSYMSILMITVVVSRIGLSFSGTCINDRLNVIIEAITL